MYLQRSYFKKVYKIFYEKLHKENLSGLKILNYLKG